MWDYVSENEKNLMAEEYSGGSPATRPRVAGGAKKAAAAASWGAPAEAFSWSKEATASPAADKDGPRQRESVMAWWFLVGVVLYMSTPCCFRLFLHHLTGGDRPVRGTSRPSLNVISLNLCTP